MIALARQSARAAHHGDPAKLAKAGLDTAFAGDRWMIGIEFNVAGNKEIEKTIVIVITPGRARRPSAQRDSSFFSNVGKGAVVIIVVEAVLAEIRNVDVGPAIVIVIANHGAKAPALVGDSGLVGDVGKGAVVIVVEQHGPRWSFLALQRGKRGPVHQIDVEPSVIVIVEKSNARSGRLENRVLLGTARLVMKLIEAGGVGNVSEDDGSAVDKTACGNRAVESVLDRSVRGTGA